MTEITPAQIAAALTGGDDVNETLNGWVDVSATEGNSVARITFTPVKSTNTDSDPDKENTERFLAVVIRREQPPIVAARPNVDDHTMMQGPRFGEDEGESPQNGWSVFATNHIVFAGSGHISFAEARRMGAALIALADAREAGSGATS